MRPVVVAVLIACTLLVPDSSRGAEPARRALELDAFGGALRSNVRSVPGSLSTRNGGVGLALVALYRSRYFLAPFAEVGYFSLAASDRVVDVGSGPVSVLNRSWAFGFAGGVALDVWRLRFRAGLGFYDLVVRTVTPGARSTVSELDFGYLAGVTVYPLVRDRFRVGVEARAGFIVEAETGFLSLGATLGGDAITF
jgi:hypothetical protein